MITMTIAESIFQTDKQSINAAQAFMCTAQSDVGLEWVGRHSFEIGRRLLYLRVATDADTACLRFNELVCEWYQTTHPWRDDVTFFIEDTIRIETIQLFVEILESEPYSDQYFIEGLMETILNSTPSGDMKYLIPLSTL